MKSTVKTGEISETNEPNKYIPSNEIIWELSENNEDNENYTDIVSDRNISSNKMYLKDEIYAAAKFGDTSELIKLLKIGGLEIELKSGKFVVKSSDGDEKVFNDEIELINFGKNYARS